MSLSVCLISHNEEINLERTLKAVKNIANEIIIIDSFSNDKTEEIAKKFNAKFYKEKWKGFVAQKNSALEKCKYDWILCLDCDEVITSELAEEIKKAIIDNNTIKGYFISRKTFYLGKLLKYAWQPDEKLRLVKRSANPRWIGEEVHEELEVDGKTDSLENYMVHYSYKNMFQHFEKTINYARLSARSYQKQGKKFKISNLAINPTVAFFRLYISNKGFLDGIHGFVAAMSSMIGTFLKYAFLWEIELKIDE